jgi:ubiquinone/menaquinone biosynthesis C-methylase UbiE
LVTLPEAAIESHFERTSDVRSSGSIERRRLKADLVPDYLSGPYAWAYLNRRNACFLDRDAVVNAILLGNHRRLRHSVLSEVTAGEKILQAAHVYGRLIPELARRVGPRGRIDIVDIVPLQAALCRRKLRGYPNAHVRVADVRALEGETYDVVNSFFLLHEIPDQQKGRVVDMLLARVAAGGKAIFVDYHAPDAWHPLRAFYRRLFDWLEPYAETMWHHELSEFASEPRAFRWQKTTMFGGVFQKTVAYRLLATTPP